jgi:hypothetical protein
MRAETARLVLSDPTADEARYFTGFAPPQTHGDGAVLKAQEWVHMRDGRGVSLAALAKAAGLERLTDCYNKQKDFEKKILEILGRYWSDQ